MTERPRVIPAPAGGIPGRLRRGRDRFRAWARRHPRLVDTALVGLLALLSAAQQADGTGPVVDYHWSPLLVIALLLPLIWRRRAPFTVFLIIAGATLVQLLTGPPLTAEVAPLVAFYTVAAYAPARRVLIAAAIMGAAAVLLVIRFAPGQLLVSWVFISGLITAVGFIGFNLRTRRAYLAALEDRAARLEQERDREAQLAASGERARIAREMHDVVAHNLAVMIALADGAAYTADQDLEEAITIMGQVSETGRSALTEMRRLLGVMRQAAPGPAHAPQPTLADLDELLATMRSAGLPTRLTVSGQRPHLPPSAELAIYRLIQEALTNTLKHADATEARIRLAYLPASVEVDIIDDGRGPGPPAGAAAGSGAAAGGAGAGRAGTGGFGPGEARSAGAGPGRVTAGTGETGEGQGIVGMRERAAVFGGTVSAGPGPGGGWRVHAVLHLSPMPAARESMIAAERAIAAQRAASEQVASERAAAEAPGWAEAERAVAGRRAAAEQATGAENA